MNSHAQIRYLIARQAAQLVYAEGLDFHHARKKAAKRFGSGHALSHGHYLPSYSDIHQELEKLVLQQDQNDLTASLNQLRLTALETLTLFDSFTPYLVGSVLSGTLTPYSIITLHLFADHPADVEEFLNQQEIPFTTEEQPAYHKAKRSRTHHLYLELDEQEIDCIIQPRSQRQQLSKSVVTGQAMQRATAKQVRKLLTEDQV